MLSVGSIAFACYKTTHPDIFYKGQRTNACTLSLAPPAQSDARRSSLRSMRSLAVKKSVGFRFVFCRFFTDAVRLAADQRVPGNRFARLGISEYFFDIKLKLLSQFPARLPHLFYNRISFHSFKHPDTLASTESKITLRLNFGQMFLNGFCRLLIRWQYSPCAVHSPVF
jgi:hypothetical protein